MPIAHKRSEINPIDCNTDRKIRFGAMIGLALGLTGCDAYKFKDVQDVRAQACHDLALENNTRNNDRWKNNVKEEDVFRFTSGDFTNVPHFYEDAYDDNGQSTSGWVVFQLYGYSVNEHGTAADDSNNPWIADRDALVENYIRFVGLNDNNPLDATEIYDTEVKLDCGTWNGLRDSDDDFCVAVHVNKEFINKGQRIFVEALEGCERYVTIDGDYTTEGAVPSTTEGFCQGNKWGDCNPW